MIETNSSPILINQPTYIHKLREVSTDLTFESFRSVSAAFGWLANSLPNLCCSINRAAQVTVSMFCKRHIKDFNDAIRHAKNTHELKLTYKSLNISSLQLSSYMMHISRLMMTYHRNSGTWYCSVTLETTFIYSATAVGIQSVLSVWLSVENSTIFLLHLIRRTWWSTIFKYIMSASPADDFHRF